MHPPKNSKEPCFFLCQLHPSHERIASTSSFCVRNLRCTAPDGSWDHMLIERLIFPINPVWLMVRKSDKLTSWGLVVEIPLFAKVLIHPRWLFGISEPSTSYHLGLAKTPGSQWIVFFWVFRLNAIVVWWWCNVTVDSVKVDTGPFFKKIAMITVANGPQPWNKLWTWLYFPWWNLSNPPKKSLSRFVKSHWPSKVMRHDDYFPTPSAQPWMKIVEPTVKVGNHFPRKGWNITKRCNEPP